MQDAEFVRLSAQPAAQVADGDKAYVPATSPADFNKSVLDGILADGEGLHPDFRRVFDEADDAVTAFLGEANRPAGLALGQLLGKARLAGMIPTGADAERVTPDGIRDALLRAAKEGPALHLAENTLKAVFGEPGHALKYNPGMFDAFLARNKAAVDALATADSQAAFATARDNLERLCRDFAVFANSLLPTHLGEKDAVYAKIAGKLGVGTKTLKAEGAFDFEADSAKTAALIHRIMKDPRFEDLQAAQNEFRRLSAAHADRTIALLDEVGRLPLPDKAKDAMKATLLGMGDVEGIDLDAIKQAAEGVSLDRLAALLDDEDQDNDAIRAELARLSDQFGSAVAGLPGGMGPEDLKRVRVLFAAFAVQSRPGLAEKVDWIVRNDPESAQRVPFEFLHFTDQWNVNPQSKTICRFFTAPRVFDAKYAAPARAAGCSQADIAMIKQAFVLCKTAYKSFVNDETVFGFVMDPKSPERRLMSCGGRFTVSSGHFQEGISLLNDFGKWYNQVVAGAKNGNKTSAPMLDFAADHQDLSLPGAAAGVAKFVFDELARIPPGTALKPKGSEALFGVENNKAMRFIARGYATGLGGALSGAPAGKSLVNTLSAMPPEKRTLLYDVFDVLDPLPKDERERDARKPVPYPALLVARVLKNYGKLAQMRAEGQFDRKSLVNFLYGDFKIWDGADNDQIKMEIDHQLGMFQHKKIKGKLGFLLETTGMKFDECVQTCKQPVSFPAFAPGLSASGGSLAKIAGTAEGRRDALLDDLAKPLVPYDTRKEGDAVAKGKGQFVFRFPDGETFVSRTGKPDDEEARNHNKAITDKIEAFCGNNRPEQLAGVYSALSQDGLAPCRNGFRSEGIYSDSHMPVTFTLSKDDATGAATITYTAPEGFPPPFIWTATVGPDGSIATTPLQIGPRAPEKGPAPVPDINLTVVDGVTMPRLAGKEDLMNYVLSLDIKSTNGKVSEDATAQDAKGVERKTFHYRGIIFRSDDRREDNRTLQTGFTSKNDLSVPENRTEAMGLGAKSDDGSIGGWGATGTSGVSCA